MFGDRRVVAALGVLAVAVIVAGVLVVPGVLGGDDGPDPADDAEAFLAAWGEGDLAAMREHIVEPPDTFDADYATLTDGLAIQSADFELGEIERDGDEATASFDATLFLGGLGEWSYAGELALRRIAGEGGADDRWGVVWSPATVHPELREGQRLVRTRERPARGVVTGADGQPLVSDQAAVTVGIEPRRMQDRDEVKAVLQEQLDVDPATVDTALDRPGVQPDHFVPIVTVRADRYQQVRPIIYPVPGLVFQPTTMRGSTVEGFARHVLGRTGEITAEQLEELGPTYAVGDIVGQTGLEASFEARLAGTPSGEVQVVGADDEVVGVIDEIEGAEPQPVATTIDPEVQAAVETALSGVEQPAAIVVVDGDGNIRGAASRPLDEDLNRALGGSYPPGSTFKVVTTSAFLAAGVTPQTSVECPPTVTAGGRTFRNFESSSLGPVPFATAFAESCNTAFINTVAPVPTEDLMAAAEQFGFNTDYTVGLTTEGGSYPEPVDATETAAAAIGQGRVLASPLHMATVAGAVMDGTWEAPVLLPEDEAEGGSGGEGGDSGDGATPAASDTAGTGPTASAGGDTTGASGSGDTTDATAAEGGASRPEPRTLEAATRDTLASLMRRVVTDGSGTRADVPGREVAGKTGTAEFGSGDPLPTHAWFIGFDGDLAAAVLVEGGGVGGRVAAPIANRLFASLPSG